MNKGNTKFVGDVGEELASRFLVKHGFSIVERNYRKKWGEIDIVATSRGVQGKKKPKELHFVEVKTQKYTYSDNVSREPARAGSSETRSASSGKADGYRPEEKVHPEKLRRMKRAIETYMVEIGVPRETELDDKTKPDLYIDVMTVLLDPEAKKAKIRLLENVIVETWKR